MRKIGHELHDQRLSAAAAVPHYFVTIEEELAVEIQSRLDFELGKFRTLFAPYFIRVSLTALSLQQRTLRDVIQVFGI